MKNWEKYENVIKKIGDLPAITYSSRRPVHCGEIRCSECLVTNKNKCAEESIAWLYSEREPPKLTRREKLFLDEIYSEAYIARNKNGALYMYKFCPLKQSTTWSAIDAASITQLNPGSFSFITWDDEAPWTLTRLRELEVEESKTLDFRLGD